MSRAINIAATVDHVVATCARKNVGFSAIEPLHTGGTRLVMNNSVDTALIAKAYGAKVITGTVVRMPTRLLRSQRTS